MYPQQPGPDSSIPLLFYNGCLYNPDELELPYQIIKDHHNTPMAGHPKVLVMCQSIHTSYWWPGLLLFVCNYVKGCAMCQQFKVNMRPLKPSLVSIESLLSQIFGQVGIDFITDLPLSKGFDFVIVVVDHGLSKRVILTPCQKKGLRASYMAHLYVDNIYL